MAGAALQGQILDNADGRAAAASAAGTNYIQSLSAVSNSVTGADGSNLSTLTKAQIDVTTAETKYQVELGMPKKAADTTKKAAESMNR